ncbi:hypothetical protein M3231_18945 [Neobacillus mesonae]|nr:hypothetical protein [Neobacillus mesonae]
MTGFFGFLFIIGGLIAALSPHTAWYLSIGWRFKDTEPSDLALVVERIAGIILAVIGFILIVSSCSSGSADKKWPEEFKDKLAAGEVKEITVGLIDPVPLSQAEVAEVIRMIQNSELRAFDLGGVYGANNTGTIVFQDNTSVELVMFGSSGGIELHPDATDKKYMIVNKNLERWFQNNYQNQ